METKQIREWVDAIGVENVAQRLGVGIDTVGRWCAGRPIPSTRVQAVARVYERWARRRIKEATK